MLANSCELVNVYFQLYEGGQVVEGQIPVSRNIAREDMPMKISRGFAFKKGVPLWQKKSRGVNHFECDSTCL